MSAVPDAPVTAFLEHRAPPHWVIERARQTAMKSPCAKSKRGAAIFYPETERNRINGLGIDPLCAAPDDYRLVFGAIANNIVTGDGFNGPPEPMACDASALCKRDCKYLCLHAEERAIVEAAALDDLTACELVHVKVVDGVVVPGGGPSCWQCSRKVLEHKLAGVWLYERRPVTADTITAAQIEQLRNIVGFDPEWCDVALSGPTPARFTLVMDEARDVCARKHTEMFPAGEWVFYTALEFHTATLKACELGLLFASPSTDTR